MATDVSTNDQPSEPDLHSFLRSISLEHKFTILFENGLKEVGHLQDIQESDITQLSLTIFEFRRIRREIESWLKKKTQATAADKDASPSPRSQYRTSSMSTVISLPKAFKNMIETRDGQGNIVVSNSSLKRKFKNLWYENPVNPTQVFSNSFILQMAEQRLQFEKSLRDCELWCRKQRSKRIRFLLATS